MQPTKLFALWLGLIAVASCTEVRTDLVPVQGEPGPRPERDGGPEPQDAGAPALCGERVCKCANGKDDDRDELIDGLDPECTSIADDDEGSFATGPKGPLNECEDCFWDDNDSATDDGCAYPAACRREGPMAMPAPPMMAPMGMMCRSCAVEPRCIDSCRSRTPNGCDCFGCCAVTGEDGVAVNVILGDECAVKNVNKPDKCPPCVPNPECFNPCGACEQCFGKSAEQIAAECGADAAVSACEDGYLSCSGDIACPEGFYCVLGCCMVTVF